MPYKQNLISAIPAQVSSVVKSQADKAHFVHVDVVHIKHCMFTVPVLLTSAQAPLNLQVTLVVNFNPPVKADMRSAAFETYLHRIGRSGRFGRKGAAFNLVAGRTENAVIDEIADYYKIEIPELPWDDEDKFKELLVEAGLSED